MLVLKRNVITVVFSSNESPKRHLPNARHVTSLHRGPAPAYPPDKQLPREIQNKRTPYCGQVDVHESAPQKAATLLTAWRTDHSTRRRLLTSVGSAVAAAVGALLSPPASSANIKVPSQSRSKNLQEAQRRGDERLAELEAERGEIVLSPFGMRYRESRVGTGEEVDRKRKVSFTYKLFQANGTYVDSVGYGLDSLDDFGDFVTFRYGAGQVPLGLEIGMEGMKVGGLRRIEIPPNLGWMKDGLVPRPTGRVAQRRFNLHKDQLLIMEVELMKVK